jgi:quinoprotein glucose dehydrogenase
MIRIENFWSVVVATGLFLFGSPGGFAQSTPIHGEMPQTVDDDLRTDVPEVYVETWVDSLVVPWTLVFLPTGDGLVAQRPGQIMRIPEGTRTPESYKKIDVVQQVDSGLMGLALHPDFENQPYVYAMHTYRGDDEELYNRVIRLRHEGSTATFDRVIIDGITGDPIHIGGRIAFGPDGMLYIGTGDVGRPDTAQDMGILAGKILRVTPTGEIPADNPFDGSPIWTYGNRVVQGLTWDPETGTMFNTEHGPSGERGVAHRDEINIIRKGENYGWPEAVGAPQLPAYDDPIASWKRQSVPPAGLTFYRGDLYVGSLGAQSLLRLEFEDHEAYQISSIERWFARDLSHGVYGRLRDVTVGPDSLLYVTTSNTDGRAVTRPHDDKILRIHFIEEE